jgi:hypothetical protein
VSTSHGFRRGLQDVARFAGSEPWALPRACPERSEGAGIGRPFGATSALNTLPYFMNRRA